ncbi:uroporphyrinogen-III synthase [Alicyclobacillus sendaiensis]|uniref:uroporphyrinogen-III synthase n=1 Tax=Alicyclobacillus sendaiensis TaxID=192387 RepID=UPI000783DF30|nr:uroporphyrinogen-III synthase [Alicyclobacillus sendaiensis]
MPRPGIIVTQSGDRGALLAGALSDRGFSAEHLPLIETVPLAEAVKQLAAGAADGDAWVFTSSAAVRAIAGHERAVAKLRAAPAAYALGAGTWRALQSVAPQSVCFSGVRGAQDFAKRLVETCPPPCGFIFPRGRLTLEALPDELRRAGRRVQEWVVYDTVLQPWAADRLTARTGDVVVVFSPSAVAAIAAHVARDLIFAPGRFIWLPFGATTARALRQLGVQHLAPPPEPSHEALIRHLETLYPLGA